MTVSAIEDTEARAPGGDHGLLPQHTDYMREGTRP